jgi:hypothetical protein
MVLVLVKMYWICASLELGFLDIGNEILESFLEHYKDW